MATIPVECSDEIITFQSEVILNFRGDFDSVTEAEKNLTQRGFGVTYNGLAETFCDPLFREVVDATVTEAEEIAVDERRSLQQNASRFFRFRFFVNGKCRSCPSDTRLFDDATARRFLEAMQGVGPQRQLQQQSENGNCTCPAQPVDDRAPTEAEYTVGYQAWLEAAHDRMAIDPEHIERILSTEELTSGSSPGMHMSGTMLMGQFSLLLLLLFKVVS